MSKIPSLLVPLLTVGLTSCTAGSSFDASGRYVIGNMDDEDNFIYRIEIKLFETAQRNGFDIPNSTPLCFIYDTKSKTRYFGFASVAYSGTDYDKIADHITDKEQQAILLLAKSDMGVAFTKFRNYKYALSGQSKERYENSIRADLKNDIECINNTEKLILAAKDVAILSLKYKEGSSMIFPTQQKALEGINKLNIAVGQTSTLRKIVGRAYDLITTARPTPIDSKQLVAPPDSPAESRQTRNPPTTGSPNKGTQDAPSDYDKTLDIMLKELQDRIH